MFTPTCEDKKSPTNIRTDEIAQRSMVNQRKMSVDAIIRVHVSPEIMMTGTFQCLSTRKPDFRPKLFFLPKLAEPNQSASDVEATECVLGLQRHHEASSQRAGNQLDTIPIILNAGAERETSKSDVVSFCVRTRWLDNDIAYHSTTGEPWRNEFFEYFFLKFSTGHFHTTMALDVTPCAKWKSEDEQVGETGENTRREQVPALVSVECDSWTGQFKKNCEQTRALRTQALTAKYYVTLQTARQHRVKTKWARRRQGILRHGLRQRFFVICFCLCCQNVVEHVCRSDVTLARKSATAQE